MIRALLRSSSRLLPVLLLAAAPRPAPSAGEPTTPTSVAAAAPAADWRRFRDEDLLVLDLADGGRVVLALAPDFAPVHGANIRALARSGQADATVIERVQDNYVVQWGDPANRPLPPGAVRHPPAEHDRPAADVGVTPVPFPDAYAPRVGLSGAFPVAEAGGRAWLTHCYGMVGVGRDLAPDTGNGAELYAVIGQAPRALDRNIAVVGRVVAGMERLSALPRGTGDLGFYAANQRRPVIRRVRVAADLPPAERPRFEWLEPSSGSFARWLAVKANRHDAFFERPANGLDLCNALPPVRPVAAAG
jgi:peptidylprolyl isomerase